MVMGSDGDPLIQGNIVQTKWSDNGDGKNLPPPDSMGDRFAMKQPHQLVTSILPLDAHTHNHWQLVQASGKHEVFCCLEIHVRVANN